MITNPALICISANPMSVPAGEAFAVAWRLRILLPTFFRVRAGVVKAAQQTY